MRQGEPSEERARRWNAAAERLWALYCNLRTRQDISKRRLRRIYRAVERARDTSLGEWDAWNDMIKSEGY